MRKLFYWPTNGCNPATGYGKNEYGLMQGLVQRGITLDAGADKALVVGNARWCDSPMLRDKKIYLYTMSESDRVSAEWVEVINRRCAAVFVPCPGLVGIYQNSGVKVPVICAYHGVDQSVPEFAKRVYPEGEKPFIFLTYSLGDCRKGDEVALAAFMRVCGGNPKYRLQVKVRSDMSWWSGCSEPQVEVIPGEIGESAWHSLLSSAHVFLYPSRGEGWGMPPREAVLSGLPTAATRWLGMWDVDMWGMAIDTASFSRSEFSDVEANAKGSQWVEPDQYCLENIIRRLIYPYSYCVESEYASTRRSYLMNTFTYSTFANNLIREIYL